MPPRPGRGGIARQTCTIPMRGIRGKAGDLEPSGLRPVQPWPARTPWPAEQNGTLPNTDVQTVFQGFEYDVAVSELPVAEIGCNQSLVQRVCMRRDVNYH